MLIAVKLPAFLGGHKALFGEEEELFERESDFHTVVFEVEMLDQVQILGLGPNVWMNALSVESGGTFK